MIRYMVILLAGVLSLQLSHSQAVEEPRSPQDWVMSKNYPATYLIFKDTELHQRLFSSPVMEKTLAQRMQRYMGAKDCEDLTCVLQAFRWNSSEILVIAEALVEQVQQDTNFMDLVRSKLMPTHAYGVSRNQSPQRYLLKALQQDMRAANYTIDVYGGGKKPNYPKIDSISFDATSASFLTILRAVQQDVLADCEKDHEAAFLSMLTAVRLLEVNERMDAASLEPLIGGENRQALEKIKSTNFNDYPYSLLLVLGAGPSVYNQPISPTGMLRARMAARAYFDGQAPFIVLSGGRVHPYKTPFIEALEMKRYLRDHLAVPPEAIVLDPHARHTTTNLRNTARLMLRYGFPRDQYALMTSSERHIDAVERMEARCIKELGYMPYVLGERINERIMEFRPRLEALIVDPDEPLDP